MNADPSSPEGMAASAAMEAFVGRKYEAALQHFTRAIALNPLNHTYFTNRSSVYAHLGNVNAAFADAEAAVTLRPDRPTGYLCKGWALRKMGRPQEALQAFEIGLRIAPEHENLRIAIEEVRAYLHSLSPPPASSSSSSAEPAAQSQESESSPWQCTVHDFQFSLHRTGDRIILGEGGAAMVYQGLYKGRECAIKEISWRDCNETTFMREARLLHTLDHENICKIFAACKSEKERCFYILMEKHGQSLEQRLSTEALDFGHILNYSLQIARGINYLHESTHPIIHRDIKPANVLFDSHGNVKLIDFGLAKVDGLNQTCTFNGARGTFRWMAPERLEDPPIITPSCDVFSYGLVLWQMVSRKLPFHTIPKDHQVLAFLESDKPINLEWPASTHPIIMDIATRCVNRDYRKRPPMREILFDLENFQKTGIFLAKVTSPPKPIINSIPIAPLPLSHALPPPPHALPTSPRPLSQGLPPSPNGGPFDHQQVGAKPCGNESTPPKSSPHNPIPEVGPRPARSGSGSQEAAHRVQEQAWPVSLRIYHSKHKSIIVYGYEFIYMGRGQASLDPFLANPVGVVTFHLGQHLEIPLGITKKDANMARAFLATMNPKRNCAVVDELCEFLLNRKLETFMPLEQARAHLIFC